MSMFAYAVKRSKPLMRSAVVSAPTSPMGRRQPANAATKWVTREMSFETQASIIAVGGCTGAAVALEAKSSGTEDHINLAEESLQAKFSRSLSYNRRARQHRVKDDLN